jgi:hypothetical protein
MNKKILLIIQREFLSRVKKKSFLIMTILGPVLMAGVILSRFWLEMIPEEIPDAEAEEDDGGRAGSAKDVSPPPPTPEAAYAPAPPLSGSRKRRLSYSEADTKRTRGNDAAVQLPVVAGSRKRTLEAAVGGWDEDSDRDNT